jgi:hypothetical protein
LRLVGNPHGVKFSGGWYKITRRWTKRGTWPSAPRDQRTASTYIFGAICPQHGNGAGLVLPSCNTEAMALHLEEIAAAVAPGAHAILVLDQAGWHVSKTLPANITPVSLPPKSPELNPVKNIWQFMRDNWLSNRVVTPTRTSSTIAAMPGTNRSTSHN